MATLAQVTRETRLLAKIGALLVIILMIIYFTTTGVSFVRNTFFPKPPPGPEVSFGKLPAIASNVTGTAPEKYVINTVSGTLPNMPVDRLEVYKIIKPQTNLLSLQTVKNSAVNMGFTSPETKLSDTKYQWSNGSTTLTYDILSNNFDLTTGYMSNAASIPAHALPDGTDAYTGQVTTLLGNLNIAKDDFDFTNSPVTFYTISNGALTVVTKSTDAQIARVDLFQNSIPVDPSVQFSFNGAPVTQIGIFYPIPNQSTMNFNLAPDGNGGATIVEAHFVHQLVDLQTHSTYPIKPVQQAYDDLQKGVGIITNSADSSTIDITDVGLGYYLGPNQDYLYPIYIFKGINFIGYVSAVTDSYIGQ